MNIAIIDDNQQDRDHLFAELKQYCRANQITAEISLFSSGDEFMARFQPDLYHCVFLDIYMNGINGMELAKRIYHQDTACNLIFCTSSSEHAVESYEVRASWYLTKPFTSEQLHRAMNVTCESLFQHHKELLIHINDAPYRVKFRNIYFLDCENRQAKLHTKQRTIQVDDTVASLKAQLGEDPRFLQCNRSVLVNMDHIESVADHDFILKNGMRVPIRQRDRATLKKTFLSWSLHSLLREEDE